MVSEPVERKAAPMVDRLGDMSFDEVVESSATPVVVEFFATWCGNCRRIAHVLEALAAEFAPTVRFVQVDAEDNPQLVTRFGVRSTPTLFVLRQGQQVAATLGAQPEPVLRELFALAANPGDEQAAPDTSWVPAQACTLPTAEQPARLAEFDELFTAALRRVDRRDEGHLQLRLVDDDGVLQQARDLTDREQECCSFFDFRIARDRGELVVDIGVPDEQIAVLDGLEQQARLART